MPLVLAFMPPVYTAVGLHPGAHPLPALAVVTLSAALCEDVPKASVAATVKLYVVEGESPLTTKLALPVTVAIGAPFSNTV
jgi:hypothetical protein